MLAVDTAPILPFLLKHVSTLEKQESANGPFRTTPCVYWSWRKEEIDIVLRSTELMGGNESQQDLNSTLLLSLHK